MKYLILAVSLLFSFNSSAQCWEKLASKFYDVVAIHVDSTLWSWGGTGSQLENLKYPAVLDSSPVWVDIAAGNQFFAALKNDGSLWARGENGSGQMGNGTNTNQWTLGQVGEDFDWAMVSCGRAHMAAIKTNGTLWIWGNNSDGQLGQGLDRDSRNTPLQIGTATNWVDVSAGLNHTLIRNANGELFFVGAAYNSSIDSQLSQVGSSNNYISMSGGSFRDYGIRADGSLWVWQNSGGQATGPVQIGVDTDWLLVDNGHEYSPDYHCLFLKTDGSMWSIGKNNFGQLGTGTFIHSTEPVQVGTETHWRSITAGNYLSMALTEDNKRYAWGRNPFAQFGDGLNKNTPQKVESDIAWRTASSSTADRNGHTLAIKEDGTLWAWGQNNDGQLGNGTEYTHSAVPIQIGEDTTWDLVSNGFHYSIAIKNNGTLWAWGRNGRGQLGTGGSVWGVEEPIQVGTDSTWTKLDCGGEFALALQADSTLWSWGYNFNGQLGNDDDQTVTTPMQVGVDHDWIAIAAGSKHSMAIKADLGLWTWGSDQYGQLGRDGNPRVPMQVDTLQWIEISAGGLHSMGISADHKLWTWGRNLYAQLGDGGTSNKTMPTLIGTDSTWVKVAGGYEHSYGIKADSTAWAWGRNGAGQVGDSLSYVQDYKTYTPTQVRDMSEVLMVNAGPVNGLCINSAGELYTWGDGFSPSFQSNFPQLGYVQLTPLEIAYCEYCPVSASEVQMEVCAGDTVSFGNNLYWLPGIYRDSLTSIQGCDSIASLILSNLEVPSIVLSQNDSLLEATSGYAAYIWSLDGAVLEQETSYQIQPSSNGMYQVTVLGFNGCMAIEEFAWTSVGIHELGAVTMKIYPNPAEEFLYLEFSSVSSTRSLNVFDMQGKLCFSESANQIQNRLSISGLNPGRYQLELRDGAAQLVVPLIIR